MSKLMLIFRRLKWDFIMPLVEKISPDASRSLERVGLWRLKALIPAFLRPSPGPSIYKSLPLLRQTLRSIADALGSDAAERWAEFHIGQYPWMERAMDRAMYSALVGEHARASLKYGEKLVKESDDVNLIRNLATRYHVLGYLKRPLELERIYCERTGDCQNASLIEGKYNLLQHGFPLPSRDTTKSRKPTPKRGLYFLHNSLPHASGGYATRSHGLLKSLADHGWTVDGVTRLGFPCDVEKLSISDAPVSDIIDGINYRRLPTKEFGYPTTRADKYLQHYFDAASRLVESDMPVIVHGASNYVNGAIATSLAARYGIRSVYEVRGLWEITRGSRQPQWYESDVYHQIARMESDACKNADVVITITEALRGEMVKRGVPEEKILVVPNGVNTKRFHPLDRDDGLVAKYGLHGKVVIGFVGSMVQYEGLEYLLQATRLLLDNGVLNIRLLLVGDGKEFDNLKQLTEELNLDEWVIFTGRIPHDQVEKIYSVIDIAPFPRKGQLVCEMVSPLKPFEAMAMGKAVVSSNVAALSEIVQDGKTGLLHEKDSIADLADALRRLIESPELRHALGIKAREWVIAERDWAQLGERVVDIYERLARGVVTAA